MTKLLAGRGVLAFADALERYGVEAVALPDNDAVSPVVSSHIDVSCARMPGTDDLPPAVVVPSLWSGAGIIAGYARLCGWTCVLSDALMGAAYPADVPFNVFCAAGRLFGRLKSASPDVLAAARERGYGPVDVKQGYAACSTLVLSESALVTADRGIADAAERLGAEVLRISPGDILLDGCDYGFIGGASAVADGRAFFFGSLGTHRDGARIARFCESHGIEPVSLSAEPLVDIGGAAALPV
jgi:hypothetical protein